MPRAIHDDRARLTFTFSNIGPIKAAELELGDLTVIAGRNNTGKTYLVYTLYGFLKTWESWLEPTRAARNRASRRSHATRYPAFEQISEQVADKGQAELDVDRATLGRERTAAITDLTRWFSSRRLAGVFSSPPERFENASIGLRLGEGPLREAGVIEAVAGLEVLSPIRYDGTQLSVAARQSGSTRYAPAVLRRRLWRQYLRFLLPELPSDPFVLSERFGISLFYRELDFTKSQLVDLLQKYGDRRRRDDDFPFDLLDEAVSRYARPVKDNIDYTRSLPDLREQRSEIYDGSFHNEIRKLMGGYYTVSGDGAIKFRSVARGERRFAIPLHLASSSARGLSDLYFFLRHAARRNHLLIVDEPESHLDTANQILLARLLARLVRAGLRIIVTTHSDYIIKELNNLIMLSSAFNGKARVVKRLGYAKDECIAPCQTSMRRLTVSTTSRMSCQRGCRWKRASNVALADDLAAICDYALLEESDDRIYAVLIELKTTRNREDDRPKEQLRRSLPILEYLRSACDVERGTAATRTMSVGYVIVFERENAQAPDKQRVRPNESATERYENITISTFVGNTIPFPWLMATLPAA